MTSEAEGSTDRDPGRNRVFEAAFPSHVMSTEAVDAIDAEDTAVRVSSVSSLTATGHPFKDHAIQETAPAKAICKPKRPRKLPELNPKEAMVAYRIELKKKLLETISAEIKVKEFENVNLKERILKLQKEQAELIKAVMAMKEDQSIVLSIEPVYSRDQVTRLRKQIWSKQKQHKETLQKLTKSIAKADRNIETSKRWIEDWKDYRDKGHLLHKEEIKLLQKEMIDMDKHFEQMAAQLEQDNFRSREESERVIEEIIEQNQCLASEKAISKMDRYERKEVMENHWLRDEIKIQRQGIENLLHETEELAKSNLTMLTDANRSHLQDLKIARLTEQFSSGENLCENFTTETDLMKMSLRKPVVFPASSTATSPHQRTEAKLVKFRKQEGKSVEDDDGRCEAERDDKYLKQGPLELQFLKVSGRHFDIQQSKFPAAEEVKVLDYSSKEWPITENMLKQFCSHSDKHK